MADMKELELLQRAQMAAGLTQRELGDLLGVSERTVSRIYVGQSPVYPEYWEKAAAAVLPHDAELAAVCARKAGRTLESLGLVKPAPPPATPKAPPEPPKVVPTTTHLVDSVLFAAAEAAEVTPRAIRPAIAAAFQRAAEMGMTVETVASALRDAPPRPRKLSAAKA